jgi:hypothetical protein
MTSIVVWAGVDTHGPASLYVASDSRISWGEHQSWDQGRKVFSSSSQPHIFGYWGDVLFPALAIPVIIDRIDRGVLTCRGRSWHSEIEQEIRLQWSNYPTATLQSDFSIVHGFRTGAGTNCTFSIAIFTYKRESDNWVTLQIEMPQTSAVLRIAGSGTPEIRKSLSLWQSSSAANTSRAVFSAFCESIAGNGDRFTGGPPQLGGLYRIGPGRLFGVVYRNRRCFAGAVLRATEDYDQIEWRNRLFERVDGRTKERIPKAQPHEDRT